MLQEMGVNTDREIRSLSNSVAYLFFNGLLTDIECRKIACTKDLGEKRAAVYQILITKNVQVAENILDVFRCNIHPLMNSSILELVFSFLSVHDLRNCHLVCQNWDDVADSLNKHRNPNPVSMSSRKNGHIVKYEEGRENLLQFRRKLLEKIEQLKATNDHWEREFVQVQAVVFKLLLANDSFNGEILRQIFQHVKDIESDFQNNFCVQSSTVSVSKALQNDAVLNRLFHFLSFKDIQNCRMVSRQWNSIAEPFVIKRGMILFTSSFGPDDFTEAFKYSNVPNLPFNAFKFSNGRFRDSELEHFFVKWGPNIQHLHLGDMCTRNIITFGLSRCNNLKTFQLYGYLNHTTNIQLMLPWSKFHSIENLFLEKLVVNADIDIIMRKIQPLKINLRRIRFCLGGEYPDLQMYFNDYVDFSKAQDIFITGVSSGGDSLVFNWASDVIDAERILFRNVEFANLPLPNSKVDFLYINGSYPFSIRNHLEIKQLIFHNGIIDLSALPPTLQKLCLGRDTNILVSQPIDLPFLEFLSFLKVQDFHEIAHFKNCPKLLDIEIQHPYYFKLTWLPLNIKRIKLDLPFRGFDNILDEPGYIELDLLSLDLVSNSFLNKTMTKVRQKVLVFRYAGVYDDDSFVGFLRRNNQVEKIYVQFMASSVFDAIFEGSVLSTLVDRKSFCYEFNNESGKAIPQQEFKRVQSQVNVTTAMSRFYNH